MIDEINFPGPAPHVRCNPSQQLHQRLFGIWPVKSTVSACDVISNATDRLSTPIGTFQPALGQYNTRSTKGINFLLMLATGYDFMNFNYVGPTAAPPTTLTGPWCDAGSKTEWTVPLAAIAPFTSLSFLAHIRDFSVAGT
jgi:hypothetical protein